MLSQISAIKQKIATAYYSNNYYQILVIGLVLFKVHAKMILILSCDGIPFLKETQLTSLLKSESFAGNVM